MSEEEKKPEKEKKEESKEEAQPETAEEAESEEKKEERGSNPYSFFSTKEQMEISKIDTKNNVRKDLGDLTELVASIKNKGILEPLLVTDNGELIAGFRRLEAAKQAGLKEVPISVIVPPDKNELYYKEEVQLIENIHRKDLDPVEEALAYKNYMDKAGCDEKGLSEKINKSLDYISRRLTILNLCGEVRDALQKKQIEIGHAQLLGQMKKDQQKVALQNITDYDLTVQNFADQIRWMKKIDFGDVKFRPYDNRSTGQKTLLDSIGGELYPKNDDDQIKEAFIESDKFKKDMADYVESQRELLRKKGITVFASDDDLKKKHPDATQVNSYESNYSKVVKALPGSKTHAVVVDIGYGDIETGVFRLEKPKEKKPKTAEQSKKEPEVTEEEKKEAEKTLELNRKEKLKNRVGEYRRNTQLKAIEELMPEDSREQKIMTLWALIQPQKAGWTMDGRAEEMLKELGCKRTGRGWGDFTDAIEKISNLKEATIDAWIKKATTWKFEMLSKPNLEKAAELMKFDPAKHWQIDQEYLDIYTKDQLGDLIKELKLKSEATGKKGEIVEAILKEKLKGKVPKLMK